MKEGSEGRYKPFPVILSLIVAVLTMAIGYLYVQNRDQRLRNAVERELSSIAELKVAGILRWRAERLGDGEVVSSGIHTVAFSRGFSATGLDEKTRGTLLARFRTIRSAYGYDRIFLIDASGRTLVAHPAESPPDSVISALAPAILREKRTTFVDFYRNSENGRVYLAVLAPVGNAGVIALRIDPTEYLYPYLSQWPTERQTAETLLVRREGNEVVSLTPLRFDKDSALTLRYDMDERPELPAVHALLGTEEVYVGRDYRGEPVLSALRPVTGTPWFLVARMDLKEANAASREGRLVFLLLILTLLGLEILGIVVATRRQALESYRRNAQAAQALFEAEERLRIALESSNAELERRVEERSAQLVEANRRLEDSNRELEAFAYSVAHDLRAPLRAIGGFSRILAEDHSKELDSDGLRVLGVVCENVRKMDRLITDILELSRVGRLDLEVQRVDMARMAKDALYKAAEPQVLEDFDFRVGDLPEADADASMMERVWCNLLSNSVKYSMPSPVHRVEVEGREEDGWKVYSVRDRGVGFDPRYVEKLFNLFQRLHAPEEFEGTGLGLAIVKKIVSRHGGRVWAEGTPGEGSRFSFSLPSGNPACRATDGDR